MCVRAQAGRPRAAGQHRARVPLARGAAGARGVGRVRGRLRRAAAAAAAALGQARTQLLQLPSHPQRAHLPSRARRYVQSLHPCLYQKQLPLPHFT